MSDLTEQAQPNFSAPSGHSDKERAPLPIDAKNHVIAEGFRNHTKGEALFNHISYIGFGFFLTTGVSIFTTWLLNDSSSKLSKKFAAFSESAEKNFKISRSAMEIATLFLGGTIASVLPVKWLEDSKSKLVKKFDHLYYSDDEIAHDPVILDAYKTLDAEAKQTWSSVFSSRVVAFLATFSVHALIGSNKSILANHSEHSIDKYSIKFGRWFDGLWVGKKGNILGYIEKVAKANEALVKDGMMDGIEVVRKYEPSDRIPSRIWNYIAKDAFYTAITSSTLFVFTRILGPIFGKDTHSSTSLKTSVVKPESLTVTPPPAEVKLPNEDNTPKPHVSQTTHQQRLAQASNGHELTV